MLRRRNGSWMVKMAACAAMALYAAACGGGTHSSGTGGHVGSGGQTATGGSGPGCKADADCASQVPPTSPPDCATGKCDTVQGVCSFVARDQDGDGHAAAGCASTNSVPVQAGDDCNDGDANLYPGHPEPCSALGDGGTIAWPTGMPVGVCQYGEITCQPDGTPSACVGAVGPGVRDCSSSKDNDCNGTADAMDCLCVPPATRCSGNGVETCEPGGSAWSAPVACVKQTCTGTPGTCSGVCAPGDQQCLGQQPQVCDATGQWKASGPSCNNNSCVGGICEVCGPGQTQCSGQQPQTCDATGHWQNDGPACNHQWCTGGSCTGVCGVGDTTGCGNCGTATCAGGSWGSCDNQGVCIANQSQECTPSYPYGCTGQQACSASCGLGPCNKSCTSFAPTTNMPGVDPSSAIFVPRQSGPNCFGSTNNFGPWTVCPTGSHIAGIGCTMVSMPADGHCTVINQSANGAGISVVANNNCVNSARAQLNVSCIAD